MVYVAKLNHGLKKISIKGFSELNLTTIITRNAIKFTSVIKT